MTETRYGGRSQEPCAACKHGRKSCAPDCVFRENFPAEKKREFELVQKIFGVMSLKRMMSSVSTQEHRDRVAESVEWEAKAWADDPIHGPYGQFKRLEQRLKEQRELSNTHRHHTPKGEVPENNWPDEPQAAQCDASPAIENGNTSPVLGLCISPPSQLSPETGDELMPNYFLHTIGGPDSQIGPLETPSSRGWAQQYRDDSKFFINDYEEQWRRGSQASFHTSPTIGTDFNFNNAWNQNGTDIHQLNSMNTQHANITSPGQSRAGNKLRRTKDTTENNHARFP